MSIAQRRMKLLDVIKKEKNIQLVDVAEMFNVSSMTIRRDLQLFERQGLITLTHGGASINEGMELEKSFVDKLNTDMLIKSEIAKEAASYIKNGDTIVLDCGTTTLQILKYIGEKKLRIFTNSYPAVQYLSGNKKVELLMAPGEYDDVSAGVFGPYTINFFSEVLADKVFMGTHGFDDELGASVPEIVDAQTKKALLKSGKQKYLLFEKSKIGKVYQSGFAKPGDFNKIIKK